MENLKNRKKRKKKEDSNIWKPNPTGMFFHTPYKHHINKTTNLCRSTGEDVSPQHSLRFGSRLGSEAWVSFQKRSYLEMLPPGNSGLGSKGTLDSILAWCTVRSNLREVFDSGCEPLGYQWMVSIFSGQWYSGLNGIVTFNHSGTCKVKDFRRVWQWTAQ